MAGPGIHKAARHFVGEGVIEAGLIAGNADVDFVRTTFTSFLNKLRIRQQGARHRDHVATAISQNLLGGGGQVNAVGRHQGNSDLAFHLFRHPGESTAWNRCRDGWDTRFVPTDPCVDDRCAGIFYRLGQRDCFFPAVALGNQVDHRQAIDDDEVFAHRFPGAFDNLDGKTHAVRVIATPPIRALVGVCDQEFVDEITFGAHDLDAIVAGITGELRAAHEIPYLFLHTRSR